jgi:hypothetical protein
MARIWKYLNLSGSVRKLQEKLKECGINIRRINYG